MLVLLIVHCQIIRNLFLSPTILLCMPCGNIDVYCRKELKSFHPDLLAEVKCIPFFLYKVIEPFNRTSSFSQVQLNMAPYITDETSPAFVTVEAQKLLDFDRLEVNEETFEFICNCKSIAWPPLVKPSNEHTAFLHICQKLFVPLCCKDEVILEQTYTKYIQSLGQGSDGLKACNIGFGSFQTWHGSPDARVRGTEVIHSSDSTTEENTMDPAHNSDNSADSADSIISNGLTTVIEAKLQWNKHHMPQMVSTCVVSSFIENNLHSNYPSIVPTILIDVKRFMVCLYDCNEDVLLISRPVQLQSKRRQALSRSAVLFLWLVINHR